MYRWPYLLMYLLSRLYLQWYNYWNKNSVIADDGRTMLRNAIFRCQVRGTSL